MTDKPSELCASPSFASMYVVDVGWAGPLVKNRHKQVADNSIVEGRQACHELAYAHNKCLVRIDWSPMF